MKHEVLIQDDDIAAIQHGEEIINVSGEFNWAKPYIRQPISEHLYNVIKTTHPRAALYQSNVC